MLRFPTLKKAKISPIAATISLLKNNTTNGPINNTLPSDENVLKNRVMDIKPNTVAFNESINKFSYEWYETKSDNLIFRIAIKPRAAVDRHVKYRLMINPSNKSKLSALDYERLFTFLLSLDDDFVKLCTFKIDYDIRFDDVLNKMRESGSYIYNVFTTPSRFVITYEE